MNSRPALASLLILTLGLATASADSGFPDLTKSAAQLSSQPAAESKLPTDLVGGLKNLASSFNFSQLNYASLAKDALTALNAGQDSKALVALDKISAAKLSAGQLSAFKTAKTAVDAYVLQRNFTGVPAVNSLVTESVTMIKGGDLAGVTGKLQSLAASVKPTPEQKAVLDNLTTYYKGWAAKK